MKTYIYTISSYLLSGLLFIATLGTVAAEETAAVSADSGFTISTLGLYAVLTMLSIVLFALLGMLSAVLALRSAVLKEKGEAPKPIFQWIDGVPIEREDEVMTDHEYDGIRELDNAMPTWWVYLFYVTIVFSVVYVWYYHFGGNGALQDQEYKMELAEAEVQLKKAGDAMNENTVTLIADKTQLGEGEQLYADNCAACHGKLGEGGVGPNLTDAYWIHGGDIKSVFKTIKYGVPNKGMIAWQAQLGPKQIQQVASYIKSLKGTQPANAKEAQGDLYEGE
ncbi:MAG: c-type cytochrome [Cytophagaceae bacterium]|jgi:cytochrome c oxidase cbb3-type subunit 3|nr:c-type cytochrome [Cytophagaceae bacterium]